MKKSIFIAILAGVLASEGALLFLNFYWLPRQVTAAIKQPLLADQLTPRLADKLDRVVVIKFDGKEQLRLPTAYLIESYQRSASQSPALRFNFALALDQLNSLAPSVNVTADPGKIILAVDQKRVLDFTLPTPGRVINVAATLDNVATAILQLPTTDESVPFALKTREATAELVTQATTSGYNLATIGKQKSLGLNVLLATGESNFVGSPAGRSHNIKVAAAKFDGQLIAPGEEFSFIKKLGPITETAGFQQELVIRDHTIQAELGGGICQVSTTLYRAAMRAGLPITEQRNHSLSLTYYQPPGFDSTVYPGVIDLKFRNDTPGYLLIKNRVVGTKLITELYGSSDGRQIELIGPTAQYRSNGTIAALLTRQLTLASGEIKIEEFKSLYQPASLFTKAAPVNPLE